MKAPTALYQGKEDIAKAMLAALIARTSGSSIPTTSRFQLIKTSSTNPLSIILLVKISLSLLTKENRKLV